MSESIVLSDFKFIKMKCDCNECFVKFCIVLSFIVIRNIVVLITNLKLLLHETFLLVQAFVNEASMNFLNMNVCCIESFTELSYFYFKMAHCVYYNSFSM